MTREDFRKSQLPKGNEEIKPGDTEKIERNAIRDAASKSGNPFIGLGDYETHAPIGRDT